MNSIQKEKAAERKWRKTVDAAMRLHLSGNAIEGKRRAKPVVRFEAGPASGKLHQSKRKVEQTLDNTEVLAAGKLHGMRWMNSNVHFEDNPPVSDLSDDDSEIVAQVDAAPLLAELEVSVHRFVSNLYTH